MSHGLFITMEGIDGSGKSVQTEKLVAYLRSRTTREVVVTREPGGCPTAEKIRELILTPSHHVHSTTELLLFAAARAEHFQSVIIPALERNALVISERGIDSTVAYQGFGRGIDIEIIHALNRIATHDIMPDSTFLFDTDPKKSFARMHGRSFDRMEQEGIAFQTKVRNGYLACAQKNPDRIITIAIDDTTIDEVHAAVIASLNILLSRRGFTV